MNPEKVYTAVLDELKRYVGARCTKKKDSRGQEWQGGMTIVSEEDARLDEMARLSVEAVMRSMAEDQRPRTSREARSLQPGDVFTRYTITKDGVAIDEEVTVVKTAGTSTKPIITFRTEADAYGDIAMEGHYMLSVYRPSLDDLRKELANG